VFHRLWQRLGIETIRLRTLELPLGRRPLSPPETQGGSTFPSPTNSLRSSKEVSGEPGWSQGHSFRSPGDQRYPRVYSRFSTLGSTTVPCTTTKSIWRSGPLTVSENEQPKRHRLLTIFLGLQSANLDAVKTLHNFSGNLYHLLFCHRFEIVLLVRFKDVFQRPAVRGRASLPEQLYPMLVDAKHKQDRH
jgi:hypothetical protein